MLLNKVILKTVYLGSDGLVRLVGISDPDGIPANGIPMRLLAGQIEDNITDKTEFRYLRVQANESYVIDQDFFTACLQIASVSPPDTNFGEPHIAIMVGIMPPGVTCLRDREVLEQLTKDGFMHVVITALRMEADELEKELKETMSNTPQRVM